MSEPDHSTPVLARPALTAPTLATPDHKGRISDHLANERTYLAWVRTSVALMGFGVLIARLRAEGTPHTGHGVELGLLFASAGIVTSLLATVHYFQVRRAIDTDSFQPLSRAILVVTTAVVLVGIGAIFLLFSQPR